MKRCWLTLKKLKLKQNICNKRNKNRIIENDVECSAFYEFRPRDGWVIFHFIQVIRTIVWPRRTPNETVMTITFVLNLEIEPRVLVLASQASCTPAPWWVIIYAIVKFKSIQFKSPYSINFYDVKNKNKFIYQIVWRSHT